MKRTYRCYVQVRAGKVVEDDDGTPFLYPNEQDAREARPPVGLTLQSKAARATVRIEASKRRRKI